MLFSNRNLFSLFTVATLFIALTCNASPWPFDPLSKVNIAPEGAEQKETAPEKPKICPPPTSCPICPVVEEWPIDFDGDDLAERVQRRSCGSRNLLEINANEEIVVVIDSKGEPIIYKSNLSSCEPNKHILFSHLERADFNRDNLDELLLIEHDVDANNDEVKVLGFNRNQNVVVELPLVEHQTDLSELLKPGESIAGTKTRFEKKSASYGFTVSLETELGRILRVYYFQDASDRAFYPLRIITVKDKFMALQKPQIPQPQSKSTPPSVELIE